MTGPLAQIVALTCHANARLCGREAAAFFPDNSTCKFCASVNFVELKRTVLMKVSESVVASSPDEWMAGLSKRGVRSIRLVQKTQNHAGLADRLGAAFIGGGSAWIMEVIRSHAPCELWASRWQVGDRNAPERRIWNVSYGLLGHQPAASTGRTLAQLRLVFRTALEEIRDFSKGHDCGNFTNCFESALAALDYPSLDVGYHPDLAPPGFLSPEAASLLKATMSAWVFGGMGSWNDMGFDGATQKEYERVSDGLYNVLTEVIAAAANTTADAAEAAAGSPSTR